MEHPADSWTWYRTEDGSYARKVREADDGVQLQTSNGPRWYLWSQVSPCGALDNKRLSEGYLPIMKEG